MAKTDGGIVADARGRPRRRGPDADPRHGRRAGAEAASRSPPQAIRDAADAVAALVDPLDDFRGSSAYKRDMAVVFTRRALERVLAMKFEHKVTVEAPGTVRAFLDDFRKASACVPGLESVERARTCTTAASR